MADRVLATNINETNDYIIEHNQKDFQVMYVIDFICDKIITQMQLKK